MKGDMVIVRAFGGKPLVRRVWGSEANIVYIVSESSYQKLMAHQDAVLPIGFPRADVFQYDEKLLAIVQRGFKNPLTWDRLSHWDGVAV